ncbi:MAG: kinase/pyrophosphorylase [Streptococcaceae bacterium]|jgi:regulator of PEP synthase PpsR (kinase-PPPase family)|nr:kinase/pyrophosphorylase [Streptococcaceae bacterium]
MSKTSEINVFVISDSVGDTGMKLFQAVEPQFPRTRFFTKRFTFVKNPERLKRILKSALEKRAVIIHTLIQDELSDIVRDFAKVHDLTVFDIMNPMLKKFTELSGEAPTLTYGAQHKLDERYFDRIAAMEFFQTYDDGQDPTGFQLADVVILGVSRTSKSPLSLFLANKGVKVANLPLVPQATLPKEIFEIDKHKIFGLTTDPKILNDIRVERMKSYGLTDSNAYSNIENIKKELEYANDVFNKLDCAVINVAKLSIEETAAIILEEIDPDNKHFN